MLYPYPHITDLPFCTCGQSKDTQTGGKTQRIWNMCKPACSTDTLCLRWNARSTCCCAPHSHFFFPELETVVLNKPSDELTVPLAGILIVILVIAHMFKILFRVGLLLVSNPSLK